MRGLLSRGEMLLGIAYAAVGFAILAALLASGNTLTGGENAVAADQLQYLSWVVSASHNWTIDSLWTIPPQEGSAFFHLGFLTSGLLHKAGLGVIASYQVWKPVSIAVIFIAFLLYVRRLLPAGGQRTAALALGLFGLSPAGAIIGFNQLATERGLQSDLEFAAGELFAPSWQWGYMMTAIAVGLMVLGLLVAERALRAEKPAGRIVAASAIALFCSWLQPWQGAELLGAIVICDLVAPGRIGRWAALRRHLPVFAAAVIPLVYYRWLEGTDDVWNIAGEANNGIALWSPWVWILTLGVYLPALPVWLSKPRDWQQTALRAVPALMLAQYSFIAIAEVGTFPFHAIQGMGLFLGIMLVQGMLRIRPAEWWGGRVPLAVGLCALLCVPGTLHRINLMRLDIQRSAQPYFLEDGEDGALERIRSAPGSGGVLAPIKTALSVPSHTERPVWVGQISWTPDFRERVAAAENLFNGKLSPAEARLLVDGSGARFLLSDCGHRADLRPVLGARVVTFKRYGCAAIYELRGGWR
ncbi:MAG: hypothetical protein WCO96_03595 [Actinomycetes bacterium]